MWTNYHMHTHYCDGVGVFDDYIEQAKLLQIPFLGFSSHGPVPFDCKWCMKKENFSLYIKELESLQRVSPIEVYKGLEADYIPGLISPLTFREQLDFTPHNLAQIFQPGLARRQDLCLCMLTPVP